MEKRSLSWQLTGCCGEMRLTAAIVGARRPEQIEETASAGDWRLGKDDINEIESLLAECHKKAIEKG